MKLEQMVKISQFEGDREFEEVVEKAETIDDVVAFLNSKGIEITAEDFMEKPELDAELEDDELENVSGGGSITLFGYKINFGFYGGYADGMEDNNNQCNAPSDERTINLLFYRLGYKSAKQINGYC